jgi:predicted acylesterase/phospholipase RssA
MSDIGWDIDLPEEILYGTITDYKQATGLVLSGGGMKGLYLLGTLQYLSEQKGFDHIQSFFGTSVGALISGLLIIGYAPIEILVLICVHNAQHLIGQFQKNIIEKKSLFNPESFLSILSDLIIKKVGKIPTLSELAETYKKNLYIVTIDRQHMEEPLYVSQHSHPNLSLLHAIHMSMSIPFIFGYAVYDGKKYFDGGVLDNFPILYASSVEERVFGIDLLSSHHTTDDFTTDLIAIVTLPSGYISKIHKRHIPSHASYINIKAEEGQHAVDFNKNSLTMYDMFANGYRQCKRLLEIEKKKTD